jgi:hypothetical protein
MRAGAAPPMHAPAAEGYAGASARRRSVGIPRAALRVVA